MSSFFSAPAAQRKRRRIDGESSRRGGKTGVNAGTSRAGVRGGNDARSSAPVKRAKRDESISGSDSDSDDGPRPLDQYDDAGGDSSEGEGETAAERRLRLAERYLENIREEVDEVGFDAEEIDRDLIAERLREDVAESKGHMYRALAQELAFTEATRTKFGNDSITLTSIAACPPYVYTVSKDITLVKWQLQDLPANQYSSSSKKKSRKLAPFKKQPTRLLVVRGDKKKAKDLSFQGHTDSILCVAASQDGKFVVTGGRDRKLIVWDAATLNVLRVFGQHRDAVTGLTFRRGTNQLYSSSKDRTIKIWSLNELAYVETLFGHQDEVVDIATLAQERCVSVGARDRTARLWKVVEETQLVFRGGGGSEKKSRHGSSQPQVLEGSMDRVAMIDEEMFVTGGDNGNLSLWVTHKKKPIHTLSQTHGIDPPIPADIATAEINPDPARIPPPQPRWITALATIPYSDLVLSGSWDGQVRLWKVSTDKKKLEALGVLAVSPHSPTAPTPGIPTTNGIASITNGTSTSTQANTDLEIGTEMEIDIDSGAGMSTYPSHQPPPSTKPHEPLISGIINDIAIFERGDRGRDGVCVLLAVGKEHRFGRWLPKCAGARNGAVVLEIPRRGLGTVNGVRNMANGHA